MKGWNLKQSDKMTKQDIDLFTKSIGANPIERNFKETKKLNIEKIFIKKIKK
jgi:hypothetical protein|tara:strand:- start:203 stop:358 length:156 start_codon:yes stop_codon:yes gene_type:complete